MDETHGLKVQLATALKERDEARAHPFDKRCADALADEVDVLIQRKVIDSRSPAADALLDYRNPPRTPRSDRLAELEKVLRQALLYVNEYAGQPITDDLRIRIAEALKEPIA